MVNLVFGIPGAGKTSFSVWCVDRVLRGKWLRVGKHYLTDNKQYKHIITNFPLQGCYQFNSDMLKNGLSDSLLILDEVAQIWDSRQWKTFDDGVKMWFALHRHLHCDCILLSQGFSDVDLRIRNLAGQLFMLDDVGFDLSKITPVEKFARIENGSIKEGYEAAPPIWCRYINRKRLYNRFDSFATDYPPMSDDGFALWEI